jgi:hypothetical protein
MMHAAGYPKAQVQTKGGKRLDEMDETYHAVEKHLLCVPHPGQPQECLGAEIDELVEQGAELQM